MTSAAQWELERRPELLEAFKEHVYGRAPVGRPASQRLEHAEVPRSDVACTRCIEGEIGYDGSGGRGSIRVRVYLPQDRSREEDVPVLLLGSNRDASGTLPQAGEAAGFWPVDEITSAGFATAAFLFSDVDPDVDDGFQDGVHGLFDALPRGSDAWGTIAAWAWGFSRVADLLEQVPGIDADRIGAVGHSRGGKTALWAAAQDDRFKLVMANGSGSTGAALARGKSGERIADIVSRFPHWFCARYAEYAGREEELPVDQHMLLALITPRLLYLGNAEDDVWADPASERAALRAASPAWRLYGSGGLAPAGPQADIETPGAARLPAEAAPGTVVHGQSLGYHLRPGGHDLTREDWRHLLDFASTRL